VCALIHIRRQAVLNVISIFIFFYFYIYSLLIFGPSKAATFSHLKPVWIQQVPS